MSVKRKRQETAGYENAQPPSAKEAIAEAELDDPDREPPPKRLNASRSLFVHSLPTNATTDALAEHFSQSFPLKHATVVVDPLTKKSRGYGFVTFADAEDAEQAKDEFDGSLFNGKKIKVDVAEPRHRNTTDDDTRNHQQSADFLKAKEERRQQREGQPPPKLIVRNLPWSIDTTEKLSRLFMSYGKIKQATLPKTKPGLSPGFGFVLLRGRKNAERAMAAVNGKMVDGRPLAVDWAVQKDMWQAAQNKESVPNGLGSASPKSEDNEEAMVLEDMPLSDVEQGVLFSGEEQDEGDNTDGDDEDEDEDEVKSEDGLSQGTSDEDYEDEEAQSNSTTLFIRNLPFTATDDSLYEHFKSFGPVRYARVVMDYETERSRGTAFVCFYSPEDAMTCLRKSPKTNSAGPSTGGKASLKHSILQDTKADTSGQFTLEGRVLQVSAAVGKGEAQRLTTEGHSIREARDKDKRRLYLLSEGTINSQSPTYDNMSAAELKMREDSAKQRQTLIKNNPSLHISLTRLAIRNIPRFVTSKDLKALARAAVVGFAKDVRQGRRSQLSKEELSRGGEEMKAAEKARKARGKGVVSQAKVVFEGREGGKVEESSGAGRSRGYGFIEFSSHRWALMGLRWLNGHRVQRDTPVNGAANQSEERPKRLIVEFAIENAQVVARRREREQKARERSMGGTDAQNSGRKDSEPSRKHVSKNIASDKAKPEARKQNEKRDQKHRSSKTSNDTISKDDDKSGKASKRQKIIGRKRAMRKTKGKTF